MNFLIVIFFSCFFSLLGTGSIIRSVELIGEESFEKNLTIAAISFVGLAMVFGFGLTIDELKKLNATNASKDEDGG